MQEEIWKDIPSYEGLYQVSNLGNVKSLPKKWKTGWNTIKSHDGFILKPKLNGRGYYALVLCKNGKSITYKVHTLVAICFLNHVQSGMNLIIDHINNDKLDNRAENLQITTNRNNTSKDKKNKTSKYTGVSWSKTSNKWCSRIYINKKYKHLGYFINEHEAYLAYQNELNKIKN